MQLNSKSFSNCALFIGIIMPDANKNATLNQLVGAAFGAAGQRCMALPIGIFVGEAREWIPDLLAMAKV